MTQQTLKRNRLQAYMKMYWFVRRQGKEYAKKNYFNHKVIHQDFDMWIEITGREKVYIEEKKMLGYIEQILRHYIVTEERYNKFKKDHDKTNEFMRNELGYKHRNSFNASCFKWFQIEQFLDNFEKNLAIA